MAGDSSVNSVGLDVAAADVLTVVASIIVVVLAVVGLTVVVVVSVVVAVATSVTFVVVAVVSTAPSFVTLFWGDSRLLPLRITWVHPSLLGWSKGSGSALLGEAATVVAVVVAVGLVVF